MAHLPGYLRNRVKCAAPAWGRRQFSRRARMRPTRRWPLPPARALTELSGVSKTELPDEDQAAWQRRRHARERCAPGLGACCAAPVFATGTAHTADRTRCPGETCVLLVDAQHSAKAPLLRRCTYGVVWAASGQHQPRRHGRVPWRCSRWKAGANCGCCAKRKAAGWPTLPPPPPRLRPAWPNGRAGARRPANAGGPRSPGQGRYRKSFEVVRLEGLTTERVTGDVAALPCSSAGKTRHGSAER